MMTSLSSIIQTLEGRGQYHPLMPTSIWNRELDTQIEALDFGAHKRETAVIALLAGLHLRNDNLDRSHRYAQSIEHDATGAYWHGVMHRMEGDFSNSKYWFHTAGNHPAMANAARLIAEALQTRLVPEEAPEQIRGMLTSFRDHGNWTPSAFTDIVRWQQNMSLPQAVRQILEHMQYLEMKALFQYTLDLCSPYLSE